MKYKKIKKCLEKHSDNKYGKYLIKYNKVQKKEEYEKRKERLMPYIEEKYLRRRNKIITEALMKRLSFPF